MTAAALRLQLLRVLAEATRTSVEDLEALYGLKRSRATRPAPLASRTPHADVENLKRRVLQQLLAHPPLVHEFSDELTAEDLGQADTVDLQIVEVWRAATAPEAGTAAVMSHGALLETLQGSDFVDDYRALGAQELELDTDVETARLILQEAFHKLRLRRLESERQERLADYERDPSAQRLDAYRTADQAYLAARSQTFGEEARSSP
jgi:hypothetical protein